MSDQSELYIERFPGDLLAAGDWNELQHKIKKDIATQVGDAVKGVKTVDTAINAEKLGGKTVDDLTKEIVDKALAAIPAKTNYRMLFKRLEPGPTLDKIRVVDHNLKACPLVDVYQLDYFRVLCASGDTKDDLSDVLVNFYLYHSTEKRIRAKDFLPPFEIEPIDQHPYKILFKDLLYLYKVEYTDTTSLDDLETDFWKAFFQAPNDEFEEDQYCHSPWFEKCCGEKRSVAELKQRGDWDDIWFQMRPRKTINFPVKAPAGVALPEPAPTQVLVTHFDFNSLGIALLTDPDYAQDVGLNQDDAKSKWLNVMMLLKV